MIQVCDCLHNLTENSRYSVKMAYHCSRALSVSGRYMCDSALITGLMLKVASMQHSPRDGRIVGLFALN